jgi:hypothetical protein
MSLSADEVLRRVEAVRRQIESAFADTPYPGDGYDDISATRQDDEGIVDYFRGTTWRGHRVEDLRFHEAALAFFTDAAFRYWLPAFMLAELEDPETADVISSGIDFELARSPKSRERLLLFTPAELDAIAAFLDLCERRYCRDESDQAYRRAKKQVLARRDEL